MSTLLSLIAAPFAKLVAYAAIVLVGSFAFLVFANRVYPAPVTRLKLSVLFSAAALRLALGVLAGVVANVILLELRPRVHPVLPLLLAVLPVRLGLWRLVLEAFFERDVTPEQAKAPGRARKLWALAGLGVLVSYVLDTPALFLGTTILGAIV